MAISSTKSWWLKSRVLLWSRVSVSFVFVYPPQQWNQHLPDQNVRKSRCLRLPTPSLLVLALFVHLSATSLPPPALHTRACLTTVFQPMVPLPHHAQLKKLHRNFAPRSHATNLFPVGIAASLRGMHLPCYIGLVQLPLIRPRHSSSQI